MGSKALLWREAHQNSSRSSSPLASEHCLCPPLPRKVGCPASSSSLAWSFGTGCLGHDGVVPVPIPALGSLIQP